MQNGFEKHGISHSSASAINMWCDAPHMWVANYLFNKKSPFGNAARVGVLVEKAVVNIIAAGMSEADAISAADGEYKKATALGCSEADKKRGEGMADMIRNAVEALKVFGEPEFDCDAVNPRKQKKVELVCNGDGWKMPIIGFIDFHFPRHGVIVDLKTTLKMPSSLSDSHDRQACIYQKCFGNQAVRFLYVTPKKAEFLGCADTSGRLAEIKWILNRQERFLRLGDAETLKSIVPVVSGNFYHDAAISSELFGI